MGGWCGLLAVLTACSFRAGTASIAAGSDARSACAAWITRHFDACKIPGPSGDIHLVVGGSPYTVTTSSGGAALLDGSNSAIAIATTTLTQSDGIVMAVWSVTTLEVDSGVTVDIVGASGSPPLVIAAWETIQIDGTLD